MLREEAAKLLMMMQGAYPNYKPLDKTVTVNTCIRTWEVGKWNEE